MDAQRQQDADLVIFNLTYVDEANRPLPQPDFSGFTDEILDEDGVWQRCFALAETRIYYVVAWNKLYRRSLFQHLRYAPGKRYEDQFLLPHLLAQCKTIACLAAPGYRYVQRSGSIMAQGSSRTYLDRPEYLLDWCAYFTQKGDALRAEGLLNDAIQNLAEKQCFDLSTPPNGPATAPPAAPVPTATPRWPRPRSSARCVCAPRCCASVCPPTKPF